MKRRTRIALGALACAVVAAFLWLRHEGGRGMTAALGCAKVTAGMSREQALSYMGSEYEEGRDSDGDIDLVFDASLFADTIPALHLDPKTGKVKSVECQR